MKFNYLAESEDQEIKLAVVPRSSDVTTDEDNSLESQIKQVTDQSLQEGCSEGSQDIHLWEGFVPMAKLRKNKSLGNISDKERSGSYGNIIEEDELSRGFSSICRLDMNTSDNVDGISLSEDHMDHGSKPQNQNHKNNMFEFHNVSSAEPVHRESLFSIGIVESDEKHHDNDDDHVYSGDARSCFLDSRGVPNTSIDDDSLKLAFIGSHSISFENLFSINDGRVQFLNGDRAAYSRVSSNQHKAAPNAEYTPHESDLDDRGSTCHSELRWHLSNNSCGCDGLSDPEKDCKYFIPKSISDNQLVDSKGSLCNADSSVDGSDHNSNPGHGIELEQLGNNGAVTCKLDESSIQNKDESTPEEHNIGRVATWISQLDVQNCDIVEELGKSSNPAHKKEQPKVAGRIESKKVDAKSSIGMIVAYDYLSTLSPMSSTAQMANLGLVAIPILSAFVGLKMLNLSGNAIVRITSGALPKGLHMLNLSKNKISVIEGLKELTRLRVLDLSYNRISRIGHGGNKISEIEGLHRLLKLSFLDICSNRISNSKGLKQLAANYASLQAVNIKSNPADKNVGDADLKKYLSSLLPHLAYYNKQVIRANGSKEVLDRPRRSFSSHQFDRSFRSEGKDSHRGIRGTGLSKSSYSHGKSGNGLNTSTKSSKRSHRHLKSVWPKPTNHLPDAGRNTLQGLQPSNFLRRTQSEGAFGESYELLSYRLDPLVPVPDMETI
ncbi:LRR [Musa troglodytarum]|uniref:LRR n=1 Tax=Musa troglodytarum TaxID=320322 RepID=A0A9E7JB37_9LILI|nr:LRR [Musa troglodytarum]